MWKPAQLKKVVDGKKTDKEKKADPNVPKQRNGET